MEELQPYGRELGFIPPSVPDSSGMVLHGMEQAGKHIHLAHRHLIGDYQPGGGEAGNVIFLGQIAVNPRILILRRDADEPVDGAVRYPARLLCHFGGSHCGRSQEHDGYKKIVITMDDDPFTDLGNGYKKMNMLDFLLDEASNA